MVFGMFGKKGGSSGGGNTGRDNDDDEEADEIDLVSFQGTIDGTPVDLKPHSKLVQVGLVPAKEMVTDGLSRRAETIRLDIKGERGQTTLYVDGVAYAGSRMAKNEAMAIMQMMKLLAGCDPKDRSKPQKGGLKATFEDRPYEALVETSFSSEGAERLYVRLRNLKVKLDTPEELGFPVKLKPLVRELVAKRRGLILATGPSGSGVTSTRFGLVRAIDVYLYAIFTLADAGTRELPNITKFEVVEGDDVETTLSRISRAEGDVVFLDPLEGAEQLKLLTDPCEKMVLISEIAAKDAASAIALVGKWLEDPAKAASLLELVVSQKLIRLLCKDCKEAFRPNPKLLAKVGLPPETKVLYRKPEPPEEDNPKAAPLEPCETCGDVGYVGRTAMYEYIQMTDQIRKLVAKGAAPDQIKAQARAEGMLTLNKDGMRLVAEGRTSLEELQRVFSAEGR